MLPSVLSTTLVAANNLVNLWAKFCAIQLAYVTCLSMHKRWPKSHTNQSNTIIGFTCMECIVTFSTHDQSNVVYHTNWHEIWTAAYT